tara:strand:+ start:1371 stop:1868 length:498 start_codon:yes stop_codon:yes gene_type:complete
MVQQKLKLVEPTVERDTLEGYEPLLLSTVEMLNAYWPQTSAVLKRCVDDAMHGEMTMEDIYESVKSGRMYALIAKNDDGELPDVALALILETQAYPQFTVLNIAALGGRELDLLKSKFWKHVCSWAFMNGVRTIQASVSPAMARILKRYGFNKIYETVRLDLTEM